MAGDGQRKVAFITGTTGQDGSYLVELLLKKGESEHSPPASLSLLARRALVPRFQRTNATVQGNLFPRAFFPSRTDRAIGFFPNCLAGKSTVLTTARTTTQKKSTVSTRRVHRPWHQASLLLLQPPPPGAHHGRGCVPPQNKSSLIPRPISTLSLDRSFV